MMWDRRLRRKTVASRRACLLIEAPKESMANGWGRLRMFWNLLESAVAGHEVPEMERLLRGHWPTLEGGDEPRSAGVTPSLKAGSSTSDCPPGCRAELWKLVYLRMGRHVGIYL